MAYFKTDAELMTNYVSAIAVPGGSHFVTVLDENSKPIVISLSNDKVPKLQISVQYLFDLGACFNLPVDAKIQTFEVIQDTDRTLYLVFAYVRDAQSSHVVLAQPFHPSILQYDAKLNKVPGDPAVGTVERIIMSPMSTALQSSASYPLVLLVHKSIDQSTSWGDDITEAVPNSILTGWSTNNSLSGPANMAGIINIAPAANFHGQGVFFLYKTRAGDSKIYGEFIKPDDQSNEGNVFQFATDVPCPKDATSISSFRDKKSASSLIIGSPSGLSYLDSAKAVSNDKKIVPVVISNDDKVNGCKYFDISQDGEFLSIWFTSSSDQLGYLRTTITDIASRTVPTPILLLPAGEATSFATSIWSPSEYNGQLLWQRLVSNDKFGNLTLLEQSSDLGIWRKKPFYSSDDAKNYPIQSYSMTIKAFDSKGSSIQNASIQLTSASSVTGILNGSAVTLTSTEDWYSTDTQGTLNLIIPTESIASQVLVISGLRDGKGVDIDVPTAVFDPTKRTMDKLGSNLASFESPNDLKNAKTQKGKPLFESNNMPSNDDLRQGLGCLKILHSAYTSLPSDGSKQKSDVTRTFASNSRILSSSVGGILDGVGDFAAEAWHWVKKNVESAVDWLIDTAGDVWKFVCKIAGEAFELILDCVEKVGEALTWVWNKIKVAFDKLIDFLGFLFEWEDIIKTKDQVSSLITAGVDLAALKAGGAANYVDNFFKDILVKIDKITAENDLIVSANSGNSNSKAPVIYDAQHSTSFNWTMERIKNGGVGSSPAVTSRNESNPDAQKTWNDIFAPALAGIKDSFTQVGNDIKDLWKHNGSISASDFMRLCKDILTAAVTTIKGLVVALIETFQKLLQLVSTYGNKKINVPIFSDIYKTVANHDLTAFDAMALLIAIPTTIFTKLITGSAPPRVFDPNSKNSTLLDGLVFGNLSVAVTPKMQLDFNTLTSGLTVSATLVGTVVDLIKFMYALASVGTGGVLDTLGGSPFLEFFSVILDMYSALNSFPTDTTLPGFEIRQWISYISLIRGGSHILASFAPGGEAKEKLLLVLDLATTLVNFGLYQAVGSAEIDAAKTWPDYDVDSTAIGIEGSVLNAVSGIGYFISFMYKEDIEISAVGIAVLEGATLGLAAVEGIKWKIDYDRGEKALLISSST